MPTTVTFLSIIFSMATVFFLYKIIFQSNIWAFLSFIGVFMMFGIIYSIIDILKDKIKIK